MREYENLEIIGVGKQPGGRFGQVMIAGSGKITGDLECDCFDLPGAGKIESGGLIVHGPLEVNGAGSVEGPVRAESLEINGAFKAEHSCDVAGGVDVNGSLKVGGPCVISGNADICGAFKTEGDMTVNGLDVTGSLSVEGRITAANVTVHGILKAEGEVQAERFYADGTVKIAGLLNAETVELELSGEDQIESIGGGSVTVLAGKRGFLFFRRSRPRLQATLIEADEVNLEYTNCETVRGVNVHIGKECVIDRVEYSGTLTTDAYASIGEKIKIEQQPPHALSAGSAEV